MHRCRYCQEEIHGGAVCLRCGQHNADLDPEFLKRERWNAWSKGFPVLWLGIVALVIGLISDLTGLGLVWSAIIAFGLVIVIGTGFLLEKARRSKF